ncbi:hypothetical protein POTOM_057936 [Populus tomentosa]|uniref:Uncharacterized protein n=1 Tax=Populus tomentosa TaxID=118781 RepID=A0A8X8C3H1_POPTO|nr:hypothetical protein POTOM_057936 [Populus tomentosa]
MEEVDNFESLLSKLEFLSYVIFKHILSEDDCLQFSYSSVYPIIAKKQYNVVTVYGSRPPPEVPVNQSSISCNDQGGQNNVINDSIQQTTPFPTSFPETMSKQQWKLTDSYFSLSSILFHGSRPATEVPVNQGSISCNDQGGQNNAINDIIQQTTQFPTSFPETMTGQRYNTQNATTSQHGEFNQPGPSSPAPWYQPNPNLFDPQCANPMLPGPSMPLRDQQWTDCQLPIMSNQVPAMLPGPQPPLNQWHQNSFIHQPQKGHGSMTPNATTSQHGGFNQSGPSFPAPRIQFLSNQGQDDQAAVIPDIDNMQQENFVPRNSGNSTRLPPEVRDNQSSISSRINQNEPNWPQTPSRYLPHPNLSDPRCANPMLYLLMSNQVPGPQPPMNQVPVMLPGPQPPMNQWHQNSNIHQPQPGHAYMTPNATTSEHGGFIQPGPSFPAPRSQYFCNQGQVDRPVIPNIDNVQQENFVPRSQMDNLQVRGLQNQTATPNASNPGLGTSLQSQNRGLNTQQVRSITELSSSFSLL